MADVDVVAEMQLANPAAGVLQLMHHHAGLAFTQAQIRLALEGPLVVLPAQARLDQGDVFQRLAAKASLHLGQRQGGQGLGPVGFRHTGQQVMEAGKTG